MTAVMSVRGFGRQKSCFAPEVAFRGLYFERGTGEYELVVTSNFVSDSEGKVMIEWWRFRFADEDERRRGEDSWKAYIGSRA